MTQAEDTAAVKRYEEIEIGVAAAHILTLLDSVQEQLANIRKTAEQIVSQQEESDAS